MAKKATFIPKTRINQLYTCYNRFRDVHGSIAKANTIYKLAAKPDYFLNGKLTYILVPQDIKNPAISIPDYKFAKYFIPTNC